MKINNKHNRGILAEGRNAGIAFAFVKRISATEYDTVMPFSPCKDFLNEPLFAEKTKVFAPRIFGLEYKKINNIIGRKYTMLGIKVVSRDKNSVDYEKLKDNLAVYADKFAKNYKNVEKFLNDIEKEIGIDTRTKILRAEKGFYLVKMPNYWVEHIYRVSLYTLLLRAFQEIKKGSDSLYELRKGDVYKSDTGLMMTVRKNKIESILTRKDVPEIDFFGQQFIKGVTTNPYKLHGGSGISGIKFKQ